MHCMRRGVWEFMWEGGSAWNVHRHCQWSAAERSGREAFFAMQFVLIPSTTRTRSLPAAKQTKARKEKDPFACTKSPQSLTVQFQRREYFMKMKHPKVTGIIKPYKSLKRLRLLFFTLQAQTCTHASTTNCYYSRPSLTILCIQNTQKWL